MGLGFAEVIIMLCCVGIPIAAVVLIFLLYRRSKNKEKRPIEVEAIEVEAKEVFSPPTQEAAPVPEELTQEPPNLGGTKECQFCSGEIREEDEVCWRCGAPQG